VADPLQVAVPAYRELEAAAGASPTSPTSLDYPSAFHLSILDLRSSKLIIIIIFVVTILPGFADFVFALVSW
jgi:hypothetical protein